MNKAVLRFLGYSFVQKKEIFADSDFVYLVFEKENSCLVAKSGDGLDFQKCDQDEKVLKLVKHKIRPKANEQNEYSQKIKHLDKTVKLKKIVIEKVFLLKEAELILYHCRLKTGAFQVSALAIYKSQKGDRKDWHLFKNVWKTQVNWNRRKVEFIKLIKFKGKFISYWHVVGLGIFAVYYPAFKLGKPLEIGKVKYRLEKVKENPIISPKSENSWESFTTFNPAAVYEEGKVHILYRAQGYDFYSSVGYASSKDGINIERRLNEPVFKPSQAFEINSSGKVNYGFVSGGGYGGCEDPRITKIDERIYMTYVAFDGGNPPRVALTSIALDDFLNHRWLWERPVLISPPGVVDKSCCIFPEKINGKYVVMHRIFPNILIDYVDNLEFDGTWFLKGEHKIAPRSKKWWDSRKIGAGAPPIKTKDGWLLIYQAVDDKDDSHYKVGAMLLDLKNPAKVLHRSKKPILEPDQKYEHEGFKAGVVYPCGAVVIGETLFVYYGAADSYVAVATANLKNFIKHLKKESTLTLSPAKIK